MSKIHVISGRDAPLEVFDVDDIMSIGATRAGMFYCIAHPHTRARIIGVKDHKGTMTVVWGEYPSLPDIGITQAAWEACGESTMNHIMFHKGKFCPVLIDHNGIYHPASLDGDIAELGLLRYQYGET